MDLRVYEILFKFNRGLDQALTSLGALEKIEMESAHYVSKVRTNPSELHAYANNHFAFKVAQKGQEDHFYRISPQTRKGRRRPHPRHPESCVIYAIVPNDAIGAYKFLREHKKRITDTGDIYLAIKLREAARKATGLTARLGILPDWDFNDENRHEKEQPEKRKRAGNDRRKSTKKRKPAAVRRVQRTTGKAQIDATPTHEGANNQ
jgi:hypothetical protein